MMKSALKTYLVFGFAMLALLSQTALAQTDRFVCQAESLLARGYGLSEGALAEKLAQRDAEATMKLLHSVTRQFPMAEHEFVLVGRSLTFLAALLEASKAHDPALRSWVLPLKLTSPRQIPYSEIRTRFEGVIKRFAPSDSETSARKLVFIDTVADGTTFQWLKKLTTDLFSDRAVAFAAINSDVVHIQELIKSDRLPPNTVAIPISHSYEINTGEHKLYAPYPSVDLMGSEQVSIPSVQDVSPRFQMVKDAFRRLIEDGEI